MALLAHRTYLMRKEAGAVLYEKLADITSVPDLGGKPQEADCTTLSDHRFRYLSGIQETSALEFGAYYDDPTYDRLDALQTADRHKTKDNLDIYQLWFGEDGVFGKFEWEGRLSKYVPSYDVNSAVPLTLVVSDEGYLPIHQAQPNTVGNGQVGVMDIGD